MTIKIFISHSATDEKLATELVNCLNSSMMLDDNDLRCTSVPGHKLKVGSDASSTLKDDLDESSVIIGLLTKNAITSSWVLFELGAAWGANKNLYPLISEDISFSDMPGPLSGKHAVQLSDSNGLHQLIDEIIATIGIKKRSIAKVNSAIEKLNRFSREYSGQLMKPVEMKKSTTKIKEPIISGMNYSELENILKNEIVVVPKEVAAEKKEFKMNLLDLFVTNYEYFGKGIQSNWEAKSPGGFMYHGVGMKLFPYDLVKFEKLPAAQAKWFKRLVLNTNGQKFISHHKRVNIINNIKN